MKYFWVNLGVSYKEVKEDRFLWAPAFSIGKDGKKKSSAGWIAMQNIRKGDVIFCGLNGRMIYIARALGNSFESKRPQQGAFIQWGEDGYRVDVDLVVMESSVDIKWFRNDFIDMYNDFCIPKLFTITGAMSQQYMVSLPDGAVTVINPYLSSSEMIFCAQARIIKPEIIAKSRYRDAVIQARVGQGQFRRDVLSLWGSTCPVTGIGKSELLIASHIVAWAMTDNDDEKIDPSNGIALSPAVDKLFDKGYISFSDDGRMLVKNNLVDDEDLRRLGIPRDSAIGPLSFEQKAYLARHRLIFKFMD